MASSPTTIPSTMRAWTYSTTGPHRQVLKLNTVPSPKPPTGGNVVVKIIYAGLNAGDLKLMAMKIVSSFRPKSCMPGVDYSGIVVARGPSAPANLQIGAKVFGMIDRDSIFKGVGTLCEYLTLDPQVAMVALVPDNTSLQEASAFASAGITAWHTCKRGSMPTGNGYRVLVNGASGGCGTIFVQAALAMGAKEVVGTCSAPNMELVKSMGASRAIDYRANAPLPEFLAKEYGEPDQQFDFILDTVGYQDLYTNSPKYLKEGGVFVNIGAYVEGTALTLFYWIMNYIRPTWLGGTPRKFVMFSGNVYQEGADWIVRYVAEGKLKAVIEKEYSFENVLEGFDLVDTKRARGRSVVKVGDVGE